MKVNDALPHTVLLTRTEGSHELILDDSYFNRSTSIGSGEDVVLEICPDQIYLGAEVNVENETVIQGFNGCLMGVRLDRKEFPFIGSNGDFEYVRSPSSDIISGCPIGAVVETMQPDLYVYTALGAIMVAIIIIAIVFVGVCAACNTWRQSRQGEHSIRQNGNGGGSRVGSPSHGGFSWQPAFHSNNEDEDHKTRSSDDVIMQNLKRKGRAHNDEERVMETSFDDPVALQITTGHNRQGSQTTPFHSRQSSRLSGRSQALPVPIEGFSAVSQANEGYLHESPVNSDQEDSNNNRLVQHLRSFSGQQSIGSNASNSTYIPSELLGMTDAEVARYIHKKVEVADAENRNHDVDILCHYKEEGVFEPLGSIGSLHDIVHEGITSSSQVKTNESNMSQNHPPSSVMPLLPPGKDLVLTRSNTTPLKSAMTSSSDISPPGNPPITRTLTSPTSVENYPPSPTGQQVNPLVISNPVVSDPGSAKPKNGHWIPMALTSQPNYFDQEEGRTNDNEIKQRSSRLQKSARRAKRNNNDVNLLAQSKVRRSARGTHRISSQNKKIDNILEKFHSITAGGGGMDRQQEQVKAL